MAVARLGEEATPVQPAPVALRPFLQFAKLPARALVATRRAVDDDDDFRARVAEVVSEDDVGRAGWLWLTRPPGWEDDLASLSQVASDAGEAAADRRAENEARRRLAGAEAATRRAEEGAAAAAAEAARAQAALGEERRARRAAADEVDDLAKRVEELTAERDRARGDRDRARADAARAVDRAAALKRAVAELEPRPPAPVAPSQAPPPTVDDPPPGVPEAAAALARAAEAAGGLAAALQAASAALCVPARSASEPGPEAAPPLPPPSPAPARPRPPRRPRRIPVSLPPGVLDDAVEAAEHLVRAPAMTLLVDGYNVSLTGWPELPIAEQRRRLVDALAELAARTGIDVSVVFDGADASWPAAVPSTSRLVRVSFSPADVEADDVVLGRVAGLDVARPVLVASTDRRVRDGAAAMGANVISSAQLLAVLRR